MAEKSWLENIVQVSFGVVLTALFTLNTLILTTVKGDIREVKSQVMIHLTNHDIHIPREQVVSKAEFQMYTNGHVKITTNILERIGEVDKNVGELRYDIRELNRCLLDEGRKVNTKK
jgi:hypothetical protein